MMIKRFGFPQRTSVRVLLAACAVLVAAVLCVPAAALASAGASSVQVDAVPEGYTGWAEDAADELYWFDGGVMARHKEAYDPQTDAWYWFDEDGTMARGKDVYIPTHDKWVRYDSDGHMIKGEDTRRSDVDGQVHTWFFEPVTGEMQKGFSYIPDEGKWCYFDQNLGWMLYGEHYLPDDAGDWHWYYLDDEPGAVTYGWKHLDTADGGKDVYYAPVTGTMVYGFQIIDGETYYFDEVTGAKQDVDINAPAEQWATDSSYIARLVERIDRYGSDTDWAVVVDKAMRRTAVFNRAGGEWTPTMTCNVVVSGNTFTCGASAFTVHHKARWYYQDGYDVNDWWVCYWPNYQSWDEGSAGYSLVYYPGLGYDAGQGFHYGFSSAGCVAIPDYDSALYIYATVPEGSSVIIF